MLAWWPAVPVVVPELATVLILKGEMLFCYYQNGMWVECRGELYGENAISGRRFFSRRRRRNNKLTISGIKTHIGTLGDLHEMFLGLFLVVAAGVQSRGAVEGPSGGRVLDRSGGIQPAASEPRSPLTYKRRKELFPWLKMTSIEGMWAESGWLDKRARGESLRGGTKWQNERRRDNWVKPFKLVGRF